MKNRAYTIKPLAWEGTDPVWTTEDGIGLSDGGWNARVLMGSYWH